MFMATISVVIFFGLMELILAALGVRVFREVHDPFLDFEPGIRLFLRHGNVFETNPIKRTYFNAQSFSAQKDAKTFRIFCLGGSTTYGRPYSDTQSYPRMLRDLLADLAPEHRWEVVNCGGISYSSYRLAALMDELREYSPDLIVFYEGHNEFLEERTYRDIRQRSAFTNGALSVVSQLRLTTLLHRVLMPSQATNRRSRLKGEVDVILDHTYGPESYHRNAKHRQKVLDHFEQSVERLCEISRSAGAQVILIHPASNLRDFSPFKSESSLLSSRDQQAFERHLEAGRACLRERRPTEAVAELLASLELDPRHAEARFLTGRALLETADAEAALPHFVAAKDEDVCPLRALTEIGPILVRVSKKHNVPLIPFAQQVADRCRRIHGHSIPGTESFVDHLHPHPEVHLELAVEILRQMQQLGKLPPLDETQLVTASSAVRERTRRELTTSVQANALCTLAQELNWSGKAAEALPVAKQAAELAPDNGWILCHYGRILEKLGETDAAFEVFQNAVRRDPKEAMALFRLARAYFSRQQWHEAQHWFERTLALPNEGAPAAFLVASLVGLGDCHWQLGNRQEAQRQYLNAQRIDPASEIVLQRLKQPGIHPTATFENRL